MVRQGAELAEKIFASPVPVVMACNGHAMAMGAILLLCADYRIGALGNYKIGLNEVAIGLTMPQFGVELAKFRMNAQYFNRSLLLAEIYSPERALESGFLDECVAEAELLKHSFEFTKTLARLDMAAHKATKTRVRKTCLSALRKEIENEFS